MTRAPSSHLRRVLATLALLLVIFTATRALVHALPGDPLEALIAETGTSLPPAVIRAELGLDRPFLTSVTQDLGHALQGDFGVSLLSKRPIGALLAQRLGRSLALSLLALILALALSLVLGLPAAARPGGWADHVCSFHGAVAAALPTPWIGPLLLLVFAVWLPIFPVGGSPALPAVTLALGLSGVWSRLVRTRVRETLLSGAAPGARARGIAEWKVIFKYGLAPAAGSLLAYVGTQFGYLLGGTFVTEVIFDWKGLGALLVESVLRRDYPIVEAAVFLAAASCLLGNLLGDLGQRTWDPRRS